MTLREKTDVMLRNLALADLDGQYADVASIGEVPYQANLRALKALDIKNNREEGLAEVELMVAGLDHVIAELESFRNASERIRNQATAIVRQA
jgi:hypothetical protein